jgi:hypothetical protein
VRSDKILDFIEGSRYHDTISPVGILARLAYPYVFTVLLVLLLLMDLPSLQKSLVLWVIETF